MPISLSRPAAVLAVILPVSAAAAAPIAERLLEADPHRGKRIVAKQCAAACHTYEKGGPVRVGPNLWDVVGQPMARRPDYRYSGAVRERAAQGGVWDWQSLDAYLAGPSKFLPGTGMTFVGLKKPQDRADIILYLRSLSETPQPLPDKE